MTLEEAIKHAEAAAIENEKEAKRNREHGGWFYDSEARACAICAEQHRQLAEWLKELAERRKQPEIIYCKDCRWWDKFNEKYGYCLAAKHGHWSENWEISIRRVYNEDFYCADAERITDDKTNKGSSR